MALRRGFKSEAHAIARDVRTELAVDPCAPLDMWKLADWLEIPLVTLRSLKSLEPEAVGHFVTVEPGAFSAVTLFKGLSRFVVYNDCHAKTRQASDLAHELAHALLQHPPHVPLNEYGCRIWPQGHEEEADWLGGALLVSEEAALDVVARRQSIVQAAKDYGVSTKMMQYRLNVTGARQRVSLAKSRPARSRT